MPRQPGGEVDLARKVWRELNHAKVLKQMRLARHRMYERRRALGLTCRGKVRTYKPDTGLAPRNAQRRA